MRKYKSQVCTEVFEPIMAKGKKCCEHLVRVYYSFRNLVLNKCWVLFILFFLRSSGLLFLSQSHDSVHFEPWGFTVIICNKFYGLF